MGWQDVGVYYQWLDEQDSGKSHHPDIDPAYEQARADQC